MNQIEQQRKICQEQAKRTAPFNTSETEFNYIKDQGIMENPYSEEDYGEVEELEKSHFGFLERSGFSISRNASSTSLRSRAATGESGPPLPQGVARAPNLKYANGFAGVPLTLRTQHLPNGAPSPGAERGGNSYFSPTAESPLSSRTSSSSGILSFPRQATPQNGWHGEDSVRYTAPAFMRPLARDANNGYYHVDAQTGKTAPSSALPIHPESLSQTRSRSASSPDMHVVNRRVAANAPPMPSVPSHLARTAPLVNRSQNNSPIYSNSSQSTMKCQIPPNPYQTQQSDEYGYGLYRSESGTMSPPLSTGTASLNGSFVLNPVRIRVKVPSEGSTSVLVVPFNITYDALRNKIDAKLQRHTNLSLASGTVKLKYLYDDVFVTIQTDEDVQTAFETWKEQQREPGQQTEVELYCHR